MSVNYLSLGDFPDQSNKEEQTHQMNYTLRGFTVKNKNKNKMHKTVDNFYNTKHNKIVDELKEIPDQDMKNVDCKFLIELLRVRIVRIQSKIILSKEYQNPK